MSGVISEMSTCHLEPTDSYAEFAGVAVAKY